MAKSLTKLQIDYARTAMMQMRKDFLTKKYEPLIAEVFSKAGLPVPLHPEINEFRLYEDLNYTPTISICHRASRLQHVAFMLENVESVKLDAKGLLANAIAQFGNGCGAHPALLSYVLIGKQSLEVLFDSCVEKVYKEAKDLRASTLARIEKKISDAVLFDAPLSLPVSMDFFEK